VAVVKAFNGQRTSGVDAVARTAPGEVHQLPDDVVDRAGVRVEQQEVSACAMVGGPVDSAPPAHVLVQPDHPDSRELRRDGVGRPIVGGVVDDYHLDPDRLGALAEKVAKAPLRVVAGVVRNDDDRHVRGRGHS
jgi:hypothetical protein